jgi:hypothetical protein
MDYHDLAPLSLADSDWVTAALLAAQCLTICVYAIGH